jgi:hypothetical protein
MNDSAVRPRRSLAMAALWTGLLVPIGYLLFGMISEMTQVRSLADGDFYRVVALTIAVGIPISLLAVFAVGLPLVLWLRKLRRLNALTVCVGATLAGILAIGVFIVWIGDSGIYWCALGFGALSGFAGGVLFCWFAGIPLETPTVPLE